MAAVDRRITTWLRGLVQFIAAHPSNYWVGVVTDPAVALFLLAWDMLVLDTALHVALPCVAIGAVAWTIAEYAAHRWLYHARMPLWRVGHEMHNESPELLIGLPWFATAGLVGACWYLVAYTLMFTPSRVVWRGSSRPLRSTASCIIRIITGVAGLSGAEASGYTTASTIAFPQPTSA